MLIYIKKSKIKKGGPENKNAFCNKNVNRLGRGQPFNPIFLIIIKNSDIRPLYLA
jgi:hypothetical protein